MIYFPLYTDYYYVPRKGFVKSKNLLFHFPYISNVDTRDLDGMSLYNVGYISSNLSRAPINQFGYTTYFFSRVRSRRG